MRLIMFIPKIFPPYSESFAGLKHISFPRLNWHIFRYSSNIYVNHFRPAIPEREANLITGVHFYVHEEQAESQVVNWLISGIRDLDFHVARPLLAVQILDLNFNRQVLRDFIL